LCFAQPDFLRPCHGISVPGVTFLHFYAATSARFARRTLVAWLSDRTQIRPARGYGARESSRHVAHLAGSASRQSTTSPRRIFPTAQRTLVETRARPQ